MNNRIRITLALCALSLAACATVPVGPTTMVLPGTNKPFEQFRSDDVICRQYASEQIGGANAQQAAVDSATRSAILGTAVGAVAGAAIGGSRGAGVGAGTGLVFGTAAGSGASAGSAYDAQRRYDHGYVQCMYAKGHRVPVAGNFTGGTTTMQAPPAATAPPPPPSSSTAPSPGATSPGATSPGAPSTPSQALPAGIPPPPPGTPPPPPLGIKPG